MGLRLFLCRSAGASSFKQAHNLKLPTLARMGQRRLTALVGLVQIGLSSNQRFHNGLIRRPTIAQFYGPGETAPAHAIDVIHIAARCDQ